MGKFFEKWKKEADFPIVLFARLVLFFMWGAQLINSDAYYVNYLLIIVVSSICLYINYRSIFLHREIEIKKIDRYIIVIFSLMFSCMITLANYRIWNGLLFFDDFGLSFKLLYSSFIFLIIIVGGYIAFSNIFLVAYKSIKRMQWKHTLNIFFHPSVVFLVSFMLIVLTRLLVLFLCQYPGELTTDSIGQINQIMTGVYSNHHPFFHTIIIKCFIDIGLFLFDDINAAVALYFIFQIFITAISFSYAVSTMVWMKVPRWMVVLSILFFLFMPYHIIYAITMWKDILFACCILLFITSFYRCMTYIGNAILSYLILVASGFGICLLRSNGLFVFFIIGITFTLLWKSQKKKTLLFMLILFISFILKHNVLHALGVTQPDTIESLAIPSQQVARVVYDGAKLENWERDALNEIIDVDQIAENYYYYSVDHIKLLVREKGNQNLLVQNKVKYIKLYFSLGVKYPMSYLKGWIDETRGYWNSGYDFWCWQCGIENNEWGIQRKTNSTTLNTLFREYLWIFLNTQCLRIFMSIGLLVWLDLIMFMISLFRRDKIGAFVSIPILAITVSLLLATPVFAEFRYLYAGFCAMPLLIVIVLRPMGPK